MATFDSSALANIPAETDPSRGIMQGLQLSDLIDEREQRQFERSQVMQQQQQQVQIRNAARGLDFSKPEGYTTYAQRLSALGQPDLAMQVTKRAQDLQSGRVAQQRDQADLAVKQNQVLHGVLDQLSSNASDILAIGQGIQDAAQGDAQMKAEFMKRLPGFLQGLPDIPQAQQVKQQLVQFAQSVQAGKVPPDQFRAALQREVSGSAEGQARLQAHSAQLIAQHHLDLDTANAAERTRHDKAIESGNRYGIREPVTSQGEDLKDQFVGAVGGKVTLGQLRGMDFDALAKRGMTAQQLVQSGLQYSGNTAAAGAIGRRAGAVGVLENSIDGAAAQVTDALKGVDRGDVLALNAAIAKGKTAFGNPNESRYATAVRSLLNEYSRVISGGTGQSTDAARAEAASLLSTAQSPQQVAAVLKQMQRETQIVKQAAGRAMSSVGGGGSGAPAAPAPPPAAQGPANAGLPPGFQLDQ